MSRFIKNNLNPDEKLIHKVGLNYINSFLPYILLAIVGVLLIGLSFLSVETYQKIIKIGSDANLYSYLKFSFLILGIILLVVAIYKYLSLKSIVMLVTNKKVLKKSGILGTDTQEIRLNAIETIEIKRTVSDRLVGSGNLRITGKGNAVIFFDNVDSPDKIKQIINQAISDHSNDS